MQIAIQTQIEALQQQQQQLYQQQLASSQVMQSLNSPSAPANRITAHRRVQSTAPMLMGQSNTFGLAGMPVPNVNSFGGSQLFGEDGVLARGHGRRHSVNVINKTAPSSAFSLQDGFEDGFNSPAPFAHSRNPSRVDPGWRMSTLFFLFDSLILSDSFNKMATIPPKTLAIFQASLLKPRLSCRAFNNSERLQVGIIRRWLHSVSPICCPT